MSFLECCDSVESNGGRQSLDLRHFCESPVSCNRKDTNGSYLGVQRIQILAVAADGDAEVRTPPGLVPTMVPAIGANFPPLPIVNPAMVDDPAFEA
jgi:hypothetical protein